MTLLDLYRFIFHILICDLGLLEAGIDRDTSNRCHCCQRYLKHTHLSNTSSNFELNSHCCCGLSTGHSAGLVNIFKDGAILKNALFKNRDKTENANELVLVQNPEGFSDQFSKNIWSIWDVDEEIEKSTTATQDSQSSEVVQSAQQKDLLTRSSAAVVDSNPGATFLATESSTMAVSRYLELIAFFYKFAC